MSRKVTQQRRGAQERRRKRPREGSQSAEAYQTFEIVVGQTLERSTTTTTTTPVHYTRLYIDAQGPRQVLAPSRQLEGTNGCMLLPCYALGGEMQCGLVDGGRTQGAMGWAVVRQRIRGRGMQSRCDQPSAVFCKRPELGSCWTPGVWANESGAGWGWKLAFLEGTQPCSIMYRRDRARSKRALTTCPDQTGCRTASDPCAYITACERSFTVLGLPKHGQPPTKHASDQRMAITAWRRAGDEQATV